jgi:ribonuclease R
MDSSAADLSGRALLAHISRLPHARANLKQLLRELGARGANRQRLQTLLEELTRRGELVEIRSGQYAVTALSREFACGRLRMHREGYGFLISDRPLPWIQGDIFIPPGAASQAMHGDRVVVRIARTDASGRAEGEVVRVLERAHLTVAGEFRTSPRGNYVVPHDERVRHHIVIPPGMERPAMDLTRDRVGAPAAEIRSAADLDGMIVDVELLSFPARGAEPTGRVIEILGHPDDFGLDVELVIRKHHVPHRFPEEVLRDAAQIPQTIPAAEYARRVDFRPLSVVTIDGETARDFDDAVWVDRLPNGHFALHVHIADVSYYVRPGTPIDEEAALRGTSVYFPDRAVPMLPLELSTEICSLKPGVDRLVFSALLEIDRRGDTVAQRFVRGVIRSAARMTYTEVHLLLEGDPGLRKTYAPLVERFEIMRELAQILTRKRMRRGAIDFDLPEPLIEFDEWGEMTGVKRAPRNIAHRIIEEFMLAANEAVASHAAARGMPFLYRIHEEPDPQRVVEFEQVAAQFGYSLGAEAVLARRYPAVDRRSDGRKIRKDVVLAQAGALSSRNYQRLVAKLEGKPEERILSYLMLRSLKQARYSERNTGHFALAAAAYTHFTSPIRRYPDLMVHRLLAADLQGEAPRWNEDALHRIADDCSQAERRAADAERELVEWKKARFMIEHIGDEFSALIISTVKAGFFVELEDLFVEGLVLIETLPGDRFRFHENTRRIVGERTRREFKIGDRVRVRLDRVDEMEKRLLFSLVSETVSPASKTKARRRA